MPLTQVQIPGGSLQACRPGPLQTHPLRTALLRTRLRLLMLLLCQTELLKCWLPPAQHGHGED